MKARFLLPNFFPIKTQQAIIGTIATGNLEADGAPFKLNYVNTYRPSLVDMA